MNQGPIQILRVMAYDSRNPEQLPVIRSLPDQFYEIVGRIIIYWATMEIEAATLVAALMKANGSAEHNWQTWQFSKRWQFLLDQFSTFAGSDEGIMAEMGKIDELLKIAKPVRDGIAHKRILMGIDDEGCHIRFEIPQRNNPWSKPYYEADLVKASNQISEATSRLFLFMNSDHLTAASLPGKALLQKLPNMDHMRFPTRPKRSSPQQP